MKAASLKAPFKAQARFAQDRRGWAAKDPFAEAIAAILPCYRGADNAISSDAIARQIQGMGFTHSYSPRRVRSVIASFQDRWPFLVCATPGGGYYTPENFDEVRTYYLFLAGLEEAAIAKRQGFQKSAARQGFKI